jgi:membrane peptidoglycan carboxypeptidase
VLRALVSDTRSGATRQGASTLTMQYVRNVLKEDPDLSAAQQKQATDDTLARKLREAQYAIELESVVSKTQILQNYLNIVYFGDGAYGIDAAGRTFFDTSPDRLDLAQAALLAGIVQSPDTDNPITGSRTEAKTRHTYVLNALAKSGAITPAQRARALAEKVRFHSATAAPRTRWPRCSTAAARWPARPAARRTTPPSRSSASPPG